jgi:hypothetical protein
LTLQYDDFLSSFPSKVILRHYTKAQHKPVGRSSRHGMAVQVDPIKPTLKAPGAKRLKQSA